MSNKERIKCKKPGVASDCLVDDEFCMYRKGLCSLQDIEAPRPQDSSGSAEFTGCTPDVIGNARKIGAIDFVNGVVVGDNPYHDSDARHWAWMEGWDGAGLDAH